MNYRFAWAARGFLANDRLTPTELDDRLTMWLLDTPAPAVKAQMNLLDSHDTARLATMLANPGRGYGGDEKLGRGAADVAVCGAPGDGRTIEEGGVCLAGGSTGHEVLS